MTLPITHTRNYFRVRSATAGKADGSRLTSGHCLDPEARGPLAVPGSWACDGAGRAGTPCTIKLPTCPSQAQDASSCCCAHAATENGVFPKGAYQMLVKHTHTHTYTSEWLMCTRLTPALLAGSRQHFQQHIIPTTLGGALTW